jgi:fructose-1,6-bisphosphatase/inositol monophosphatase family enzyme
MEEFAQFARRLIDLSAGTIMQNFRKLESVDHKADGSLVTIADRQAEAIMREAITKTYPSHGIIGEEYGDFQPDAEFQWTLDPIDGTINFVHGTPFFGTLIG